MNRKVSVPLERIIDLMGVEAFYELIEDCYLVDSEKELAYTIADITHNYPDFEIEVTATLLNCDGEEEE